MRNRITILVVIGLITVFMGYKAKDVKLLYESTSILPASDSTTIIYKNFTKQFGEDGTVVFLGFTDKNIFNLNRFNAIYDLADSLKKIRGVQEIVSITRLYTLVKNDSLKKFEFLPISPNKPLTQAETDS